MTFNNNQLIFIHNLYEENSNYYLLFSIYTEQDNKIVERKLFNNVSFDKEYYIIDNYFYTNYIYYILTKNGSETILIKINITDLNNYNLYENIINDNITKYNKNVYYNNNSRYFYLTSNNYIYYFNVSDNLISIENKLYADGCKYITYKQDIYMTNTKISKY